jgi:hypothetical protein
MRQGPGHRYHTGGGAALALRRAQDERRFYSSSRRYGRSITLTPGIFFR